MTDDPNGAYEGRATMREVTLDEFRAHRLSNPDGDWSISTPVGTEGPERYFIADCVDKHDGTSA